MARRRMMIQCSPHVPRERESRQESSSIAGLRCRSTARLVKTAREVPVLVAAGANAPEENVARLEAAGCEVVICRQEEPSDRVAIGALLDELGRRRMTNVLVEGGGELLGSLLDVGAIDEVHAFIAPKLIGGRDAPSSIAGVGLDKISAALRLADVEVSHVGDDIYLRGRLKTN